MLSRSCDNRLIDVMSLLYDVLSKGPFQNSYLDVKGT
jgi:hypothetical protein